MDAADRGASGRTIMRTVCHSASHSATSPMLGYITDADEYIRPTSGYGL